MSNSDETFDASEIINMKEKYHEILKKKALNDQAYRKRMYDIVSDFYEAKLFE